MTLCKSIEREIARKCKSLTAHIVERGIFAHNDATKGTQGGTRDMKGLLLAAHIVVTSWTPVIVFHYVIEGIYPLLWLKRGDVFPWGI